MMGQTNKTDYSTLLRGFCQLPPGRFTYVESQRLQTVFLSELDHVELICNRVYYQTPSGR